MGLLKRTPALHRLLTLAVGVMCGCAALEVTEPLLPVAPGAATPPLTLAWRRDVEGGFGPAPGVAAGGLLAVSTRRGDVTVLDRASGRVVGQQRFGDSVEGPVAVGPDRRTLFVAVAGGGPGVVAFDARAGEARWRWPAAGASRSERQQSVTTGGVVLVGETVVAGTTSGTVVGLDPATGAERWRFVLADTTAQIRAAPVALSGTAVLIADTGGTLVALDATSGARRWSASAGAPVYDTPAADGARLVVTTTRGLVAAFDERSGQPLWRAHLDAGVRLSAPALAGHLVVAGGTDGTVRAWDVATGAAAWTWQGDGVVSARPLHAAGVVYAGTQQKRLVALDAATGTERWATALDGRVRGAPVVADGTLYVFAEPRHVYAFRPSARADR